MAIRSVSARAWLAEPGEEVERVRDLADRGDPDWRQWLDEYDRGEAALVDIGVSVAFEPADGSLDTVTVENHGVWIELVADPAVLEAVLAEISTKDFDELAKRICDLGHPTTVRELERMQVSVEIAEDVLASLRPPTTSDTERDHDRATPGITTENA
jgi:hypothetical protein